MIITVLDTETTGDGPQDQVIEVGAVTLQLGTSVTRTVSKDTIHQTTDPNAWRITSARSVLLRPTVPIHVEARAAHHITDEELEGRPESPSPEAWEAFYALVRGTDLLAFHNAAFDLRLIGQTWPPPVGKSPPDAICTLRSARHLYPDAPRHTNQVLRYWLGLNDEVMRPPNKRPHPMLGGPPHRALPDAWVTAHLLLRMLTEHAPQELLDLGARPVLLRTCPMGKENRGKSFEQVPYRDLKWMADLPDLDPDLRHTVEHWMRSPDRAPLLLGRCGFGKHKGKDWSDVPSTYLQWMTSADFDPDEVHTAAHWLAEREALVHGLTGSQPDLLGG